MHSNANMEFLRKCVGQHWYPNQLYGSPLNIMYTMKYGESPNKSTRKSRFTALLLDVKNRYVNANINL